MFFIGMYCRHSPVVRCQNMANTHQGDEGPHGHGMHPVGLETEQLVASPCRGSKPVSSMPMISTAWIQCQRRSKR